MTTRVTREFLVNDVDNRHAWLKLLDGDKKGLEFAIPLYKAKGPELKNKEGQTVRATLQSTNEENTSWVCVGLEVLETADFGYGGPTVADD
jgi:hypothetical protein